MTAAEAFESVFAFQNERYVKHRGFTVTASMFVPRSVFDAVGPFENGVPEDIDWCRRARAKGYRIGFAPRSIVGHPARRTMDELERKWRRLTLEWFTAATAGRQGTRAHDAARVGRTPGDRPRRAGAHDHRTPERRARPHSGDRRARADPGLSVHGRAPGHPGRSGKGEDGRLSRRPMTIACSAALSSDDPSPEYRARVDPLASPCYDHRRDNHNVKRGYFRLRVAPRSSVEIERFHRALAIALIRHDGSFGRKSARRLEFLSLASTGGRFQ